LEVGDAIVPLPQRVLRLFVRLVLARGQPHARRALAFSLWPDESEADALAKLRRHLHLLRNALPLAAQHFLRISPCTVLWVDSSAYWLDVRAFSNESDHVDDLEAIVSLYRGDLATEIYTDEFILAQRETLRNRYLALLRKLVQTCFEQGQRERALKWARRLTDQDPWDEAAVRLQMTLEAALGDRTAAIKTYQRLAQSLARELRTKPMPETMALYRDILNHRRLPQPTHAPSEPCFVGRARELAQLEAWLADLRAGQGRFALIIGKPGVGKTTLLREGLRRFIAAGGETPPRLFWGHCLPPMRDAPSPAYAPWRQVLTIAAPLLVRSSDLPTEWLSRLLPLVPDLGALCPGLLPPTEPSADALRMALRQVLVSLVATRPLILVIEDIHWADDESLAVLADLFEVCQNAPLLILATQRTGEGPAGLRDLKHALHRYRCGHEMVLLAFSDEEVRAYIENVFQGQPLKPELCAEISLYARGLPLLLREAVESLRSAPQRMPATLREAIALRLAQLDNQAREALESAAVLGITFSAQVLESMLGWPQVTFATALDSLQAQRFIMLSPGLDDYAFSHQLIHQVVTELLPADRAACLHARAAHALERLAADRPDLAPSVAAHYESACAHLHAAHWWLVHAQALTELGSFAQAAETIARAVSLLACEEDAPARRELQARAIIQRSIIAYHRGQTAEALAHLEAALAACCEFPALYADALTRKAQTLFTCDRYSEAHQAVSQALAIAQALGDQQATASALSVRGVIALLMGHVDAAIEDLRASLTETQSSRAMQSLNLLGTALVFKQEYAQAQQTLRQAVTLAQQGGSRRLEGAALTMLGQIALNQGRYREAIRTYSQAIEASGALHLPGLWSKLAGRGFALLRMGDLDAARRDFVHGLEVAQQIESIYASLLMRTYLALTDLAAGRAPQDTLAHLEAEASAHRIHAVALTAGLGRASLGRLLGAHEAALATCQRALQAAQASGVPQFAQHAELEAALSQAATGALDPAKLGALTQAAHAAGELPQQARAELALAIYLEQRRDITDALGTAERALAMARACPDLPLIGECLIALMHLHAALGRAGDAQACRAELCALAAKAYAPLSLALAPDSALRQLLLAAI
jgi:predicted ATPase